MTVTDDVPNVPSELTKFLTQIPASQRETVMARILGNLDSEMIPGVKSGKRILTIMCHWIN